jgi:multidrug efflux system outer membrane protein
MKRIAAAASALWLLAGCTLAPSYHRPPAATPAQWPIDAAAVQGTDASLPVVTYRDIFKDPNLQAIIAQGLENAQDLRVAIANIASARAQYHVARAEIFPEIDASGRSSTVRRSTAGGTLGTGAENGASASSGGTDTSYIASLGVTSFEIDLFGRLRSLNNAAFNEYLATEAGFAAARLTLVANIAEAYYTLAADRTLLAIAEDTARTAERSVALTRARLQGGVAPRTDLRQAETVRDQAQADQASQTTAVMQDRNALELLVGAPIEEARLPAGIEQLEGGVGEVPAGLDSRILLRRPDVVQAEYQLRAANARIGAARAAFFPTISLTSAVGFASTALSTLFTHGAFTWSATPSAGLPIFDAGRNIGSLHYANAQRDLAVANYQRAIQIAFREVSDALARRATIEREYAADLNLQRAAADTLTLSTARYREGIDPYLNTLDAERSLYTARRTFTVIRLARIQNLVSLYQTLGGDALIAGRPLAIPASKRLTR